VSTKEPVSPGHAANDRARGLPPKKAPLVLGGHEHGLSPDGGPFREAKHGVRKAPATKALIDPLR
jgi:hypothetical protein